MPTPDYKLPTRADGVKGLLELAERLGPEATFVLIRGCRTAQGRGKDVGGDTLTILARRVTKAAIRRAGGDDKEGRKAAATRLGYPDWKTRSNFFKVLDREPAGRGDPELMRLARLHGDVAVYDLIRLARTSQDVEQDAGRQALTILARKLVADEMDNAAVDELTARQTVADRLGYTAKRDGNSRANFTKIYEGGRAPETRTRYSARNKEGQ